MLRTKRARLASKLAGLVLSLAALSGCSSPPAVRVSAETRPPVTKVQEAGVVRSTGLIEALEWQSIRVPQLSGTGGQITLTRLIPNGRRVAKGDLLVEFDRTNLLDQERDAKALLSDLSHQLEERRAQVKSEAAKRLSQLREAEADLEKAQLQLRKGPVLSEIDRLKNEAKATYSQQRVESLKKSSEFRDRSEAASVRVLELKRDRQQVTLERIQSNLDRLLIKAPQDGMVALENTWRQGSMGPPQEGDQMWPGLPVLRIFNPSTMVVNTTIDEPDFAVVSKATRARVFLDAYPGVAFDAVLQSASPIATAGIDSPVRTFTAVFRIEQQSPQLLPDLSAALEITVPK
jgi:HlyD family secretion protein